MKEMMWANVLTEPGKLEYIQVEKPECGPGQILVKIISACICNGSDPGIFDGHDAYPTPLIFGHEAYGRVVSVSQECAEDYSVGDTVSWWFTLGAFAEYVAITPADICVMKVPECIGIDEAPVIELAIASSRAVTKAARDKKVLIIGLGPSGLVMCQRAKAYGASVVGWDLYENRRSLGEALGCHKTYNPLTDDLTKHSFDLVIDAMGNDVSPQQDTLIKAVRLMERGGKIISYGHPHGGRRLMPFDFQSRNLTMEPPENDIAKIRLISAELRQQLIDGAVNLKPLVSCVMKMSEAMEALRLTRTRPDKYLKIILHAE